jgi:hypothetical protein
MTIRGRPSWPDGLVSKIVPVRLLLSCPWPGLIVRAPWS